MKFYPSILGLEKEKIPAILKRANDLGASGLHLDVMDGKFVPKKAFDFDFSKEIRAMTDLPFDIHFMTRDPENYIKPYLDLNPTRISVHAEEKPTFDFLKNIKKKGIQVGVAMDLPSDVEILDPYLDVVDFVLVMSVKCGASGQAFAPKALEKVKKIQEQSDVEITLDGGVNTETYSLIKKSGVSSIVIGSAFQKTPPFYPKN
ncbi:MAG: ribulose-phosphate 3-epimerase [Alphaproteobacteria bacterium]|nr:ribulose-phosphate 3-epimerase [Alphaproteobacteria bacterium]